MKKVLIFLSCVIWSWFLAATYVFEPLFETGGRAPSVWHESDARVRLIQSPEELIEAGLAPGVRGLLLIGEKRFFDEILPVPPSIPEDRKIFALDMTTHRYVVHAIAKTVKIRSFPASCAVVFVDGALRLPPIMFQQGARDAFWRQCAEEEVAPEAQSPQGVAFLGDYMYEIAQSLYYGLQNAYHWIIGIKELFTVQR
ncbi:MAG: hypothetical protein QG604_41 [Candidatus Dependentiae bacterium]|nr:hypothetical protein [Candidatus Dependentiae bacterium]